jgi:serine/threonine protein kinase
MSAGRERFLERLRASGLLDEAQLQQAQALPETKDADPRGVARALVQRGWLTVYQANLLAQGRLSELKVGPYRVLDRLGEGAMGQVFKARHTTMGRLVALKVIRPEKLKSPQAVQRFYQEVQAAARLHHPNIVLAFDVGEDQDAHYFAMELVDGKDLAQVVRQNGPLPVVQACAYIRQAALGLQHAHERGLVHRDVKPSNLLLSKDGVVKLLDLGLARLDDGSARQRQLTQLGQVMGTPDYLAPEQAVDPRKVDVRADLYSLGGTLYFLLTGRPPYQADTLTQLLLKHQTEEPAPLRVARPDVPAALEALVRKLMAKRPEDRFQSPAEVVAALGPFCKAQAGTSIQPPPPVVPVVAPVRPGVAPGPAPPAQTTLDFEIAPSALRRRAAERTRGRALVWIGVACGVFVLGLVGSLLLLLGGGKGKGPANGTPREPQPGPVASGGRTAKPGLQKPPLGKGSEVEQPPDQVVPDKGEGAVGEVRRSGPLGGEVRRLAWSRDGKRLLAACWDRTLYHFDMPGLATPQAFKGHTDGVNAATFLPAKDQVLSVSADRKMRFWDVAQGQPKKDLDGEMDVYTVALSKGGKWLASCGNSDAVLLWDFARERVCHRLRGHQPGVQCVAFSPKGELLLTGDASGVIRVWRVETGKYERSLEGHTAAVYNVRISPDGRYAVSCSADKTIRLWSLRSGKELKRYEGHTDKVFGLDLSPDARRILSGGIDRTVRLWDVQTAKEIHRFEGHTSHIWDVVFSPDGRYAVSGGGDRIVLLWRLPV